MCNMAAYYIMSKPTYGFSEYLSRYETRIVCTATIQSG